MVDALKESSDNGSRSYFESLVGSSDVEEVKVNGVAVDAEAGPSGLGGDSLLTYKRRKCTKVMECGKVSDDSASQLSEKLLKCLLDLAKCPQKDADCSSDCSLKHKRNIILDQICQSLHSGGLKKCIKNALVFPEGSGTGTPVKDSVRSSEDWSKSTSQTGTVLDGLQNATKSNFGLTSSGLVNGPNATTFTERCTSTFVDVFMSEQFSQLCSLLLENFEGIKADNFFDLNRINTRMKEKAYEKSPLLFQSDVQEIWAKLQKIGSDVTALAKCLSDKTIISFHEQVSNLDQSMSEGAKHEFLVHTKPELTETCALDEANTCRRCSEKADGRTGLVCDSCEEIYHISCIEPAITEIPSRSWHCANCIAKGIESSHENCIACERLNAFLSPCDGSGEDGLGNDVTAEELEGSSNEFVAIEEFQHCTVCRTEVGGDEEYIICGHNFCPHKFYHEKCLTTKQLISHGPCWYCPSCLCRACLTDKDDDKIVLCDGCDHGYHIYCMEPPRSTIPNGKWFCLKCDSGIQRIQRARRTYEHMQNTSKKRALNGKLKCSEALNKSGGVDMLLNAAKTLNYEENMAAMESES
ncbi:PHD finger protein EHD3-like isoform X2 [Salvia hispanica]|uniref:PHD finger protein EHD3-like isoform X2 n=1 Tax=Salvia hispanica TaxID=49212 RepID=UPI0020090A70|nr:PHD finger protein EHD3-like isoform X2 [Salvia hispanica]